MSINPSLYSSDVASSSLKQEDNELAKAITEGNSLNNLGIIIGEAQTNSNDGPLGTHDKAKEDRGTVKGQACDNCRVKKIKCDFGYPCDKCIKRTEKNKKRMQKTGVSIPIVKCTYAYEISSVKKKVQCSDKRISEKQILSLVKEKVETLSQALTKDVLFVKSNHKDVDNIISEVSNNKTVFNSNLQKVLTLDMNEIITKEDKRTLNIYSKIIDREIGTKRQLRQIKEEDVFFCNETTKKVGKLKSNNEKLKLLGVSYSRSSVQNGNGIDKTKKTANSKPSSKLYLEQEKEIFNSSFISSQNSLEKGSIKSRLSDITSPLLLKKLLETTEAFQKIAPVLEKINYLTDLLKTDSEIYLQKLFETMERPFYIDIPDNILNHLMDTYLKNSEMWYLFVSENKMRTYIMNFKKDFKSNQKEMDETELFLLNTVLLVACQMGKGELYKPSQQLKPADQDSLVFWENIFLLNSISFYQKFLIFPRPSLDDDANLNVLFKSTIRKLQSLFLLGHYFSNSPAPRLFVHLFSIVITISQDFHFDHLDFYGDKISMDLKIQARNLWVSCFIAEKHVSVTFGKPEFIMGFDDNVLYDKIFIASLSQYNFFPAEQLVVDYSNENTPWMKCLRQNSIGVLFVGLFLRLELLKIETVYFKTIVACKNETTAPDLLLEKCELVIKSFEDFEIKAKKFLQLDPEQAIDNWLSNIAKTDKNKNSIDVTSFLFLNFYTLKLNLLIVYFDLQYKLDHECLKTSKCIFQVELHNIASTLMNLLEYMFENPWPIRVSSEIIICYINALSPFFYNSIIDKHYLKLNLKRMVTIIKKFAALGLTKNFFDPLKWNTATLNSIFYMKILYLCHADVFQDVLKDDFKNIFFEEYTGAFIIIKEFKSKMIKQIDISTKSIAKLTSDMKIGLSNQSSWNPVRPVSSFANSHDSLQSVVESKIQKTDSVRNFSLLKTLSNLSTPKVDSSTGMNYTPLGLLVKDNLNDNFDFQDKLISMLDPSSVYDFWKDDPLLNSKNEIQNKNNNPTLIQTPNVFGSSITQPQVDTSFNNLMDDIEPQNTNIANDLDNFIKQTFFAANNFNSDAYTEDDMLFKNK